MLYLSTSCILVTISLALKKSEKKQNILRSLIMGILAYECYLCLIAGLMTTVHIPVDSISISIVNILCITGIAVILIRKKAFQSYYIDYIDILFIFVLGCTIIFLFVQRFTPDMNRIIFATSDPGTHLKMAMNFVKNKAVDGIYIGQLLNGLFIESMERIFSGELIYKPFMIQCGLNFFMAGAALWAVLQKYQTNPAMRLLVYAAALAYTLGYPYNDFLYGFVYLQMTITIVCYLIGLMQDYMSEHTNIWIWGVFIGSACLAVSIGYTLFAPPVYLSVLVFTAYKAHQDKWLVNPKKFLLSRRFCLFSLNIFLVPSFLTLWIIIILPKISGTLPPYKWAVSSAEGSIYKNLYSDFLLFILPASYSIINSYKQKKLDFLSFFWPIFGVYYFVFLHLMLSGKASVYYFYKLNYLLWMPVIFSFTAGMHALWKKEQTYFKLTIFLILLLTGIYMSGFEPKQQKKNTIYMPYTDAESFFRIYSHNKMLQESSYQLSDGLIDISRTILESNDAESAVFIGYWQNLFWYEALSNQRFDGLHFYTYSQIMEHFQEGGYGKYAVIQKEETEEELAPYRQYISSHLVYENDFACLIERKEGE